MAEVQELDKLFSITPTKRFGVFCKFGTSQCGFTNYGDDDIYFNEDGYGVAGFGVSHFAEIKIFSGIYRRDPRSGRTKIIRNRYYITKNPRTIPQQANRQKYADGVLEWQNLTAEQKAVYNAKCRFRGLSGYNLYLKDYLLSH